MSDQSSNGTTVATLSLRRADGAQQVFTLDGERMTVGRSADNTIILMGDRVSRAHVEMTLGTDGRWQLRDLGSRNGTLLNGTQVTTALLAAGDVIQVGDDVLVFEVPNQSREAMPPQPQPVSSLQRETQLEPSMEAEAEAKVEVIRPSRPPAQHAAGRETMLPSQMTGDEGPATTEDGIARILDIRQRQTASIGRDEDNDLVLDHPQVSRHHAQVRHTGDSYTIVDLNSTNGVFVNGEQTKQATLTDGARIQIGPHRLVFAGGVLRLEQDKIRLDLVNLTQSPNPDVTLLHDISLSILPREFVCVVGGSGAGKSILLNAMSGVVPASHGHVLYNGTDYYANMNEFRAQIGYVPQDDIVSLYLTVEEALTYAARLRLPHDTDEAERFRRVEEVMADLDLTHRRDVPIHALSGGQRKRVSIGVELLTKPTLFYLDEPTSGLDPSLEADMMHLMRKLADQGRTVILVTHATQNVTLCDKIVFLAPGGWLAFFGAPADALEFFGVENFVQIYQALREQGAGQQWAERYAASEYHDKYIAERQARLPQASVQISALPAAVSDPELQRAETISQFVTLTSRYVMTLRRDSRNLMLLLLQAPIIGLLLAIVYGHNVFHVTTGLDVAGHEFITNAWDKSHALQLTTMIVIVALWFGASNSAREIVKEANVYRRERMINLKLAPYVASKLVVLMGLCLIQDFTMLALIGILSPYRFDRAAGGGGHWFAVFLTLVIVSFAGVGMGLLASALSSNPDRVASVVPIILIPQILFSGMLIRIQDMPAIGKAVSTIVAGNWGMQAIGGVSSLRDLLGMQYATAVSAVKPKTPYYVGAFPSIMILLLLTAVLLALTLIALKRKDVKAPGAPEEPMLDMVMRTVREFVPSGKAA